MRFYVEWKYFAPSLVLGAAAFLVYTTFYDILIPGLPGGSYRLAIGSLFIVPSLMLAFGQVSVSSVFMHSIAAAHSLKASGKFYRAVLVASVMTFLFSFTYVIFPDFGPFYYIVFVASESPANVLPIEIAWTLTTVLTGTFLYHRAYGMRPANALFYTALVYIFITVAAS